MDDPASLPLFLLDGGDAQSTDLPLSQPPQPTPPPSATNTMRNNSCPSTPEIQRRKEEAVKRLATKVLEVHLARSQLISQPNLWECCCCDFVSVPNHRESFDQK